MRQLAAEGPEMQETFEHLTVLDDEGPNTSSIRKHSNTVTSPEGKTIYKSTLVSHLNDDKDISHNR